MQCVHKPCHPFNCLMYVPVPHTLHPWFPFYHSFLPTCVIDRHGWVASGVATTTIAGGMGSHVINYNGLAIKALFVIRQIDSL